VNDSYRPVAPTELEAVPTEDSLRPVAAYPPALEDRGAGSGPWWEDGRRVEALKRKSKSEISLRPGGKSERRRRGMRNAYSLTRNAVYIRE